MDSKRYHLGMTLTEYLKTGQKSASQLARELEIAPSMIYQYRKGLRPVPVWRCIKLEEVTGGQVTRKSLRPDDWAYIWPELETANESSQHSARSHPATNSTN